MIAKVLLALALVGANGVSAARERLFEPLPSDGQRVEYTNGDATLTAVTSRAVVVVSYYSGDKKTAFLKVGIQNLSDASFNVSESSVSASSGSNTLQVFTYAERAKSQKRSQMWASIGAGLAAASNNMAAANAGYSNTYGTYSGNTTAQAYGSAGYATAQANTYGTYSGTTYNSSAAFAAQQSANARNQAIFAQQQQNADFAKRDLESRALRANTLSPQEVVIGDVQIALPKAIKGAQVEIVVNIDVAGETVAFRFREQG